MNGRAAATIHARVCALFPRAQDGPTPAQILRTPDEKLRGAGANALFCPSDREVYPNGVEEQTTVAVPTMTNILCGATRPGHFTGVTTIVKNGGGRSRRSRSYGPGRGRW